MDTFTQKWAIISLLEDVKEGTEFYYTDFPLHVTLAGVFATNRSGDELATELAKLLNDQKPVEIQADKKALFGSDQDVAVMKIKKSSDLMKVYQLVYEWLEASEVIYNEPEYQGSGYLPHSTFRKTGSLKQSEKRVLTSVSLVDLYPHSDGYQRKIFKTIDLSE